MNNSCSIPAASQIRVSNCPGGGDRFELGEQMRKESRELKHRIRSQCNADDCRTIECTDVSLKGEKK